ncbi:MAG: riboflavin biosynthesis protein RibF [Puniceicoccales bacterium]|jgi:riboflavin kinase/FMN adenylyltransferase|nr:riboflavin biosynthesis protein RibF [Puniceicoccales bacterium]
MLRYDSLAQLPPLTAPVHLAVGVFDGVHRGHQEVIGGAVRAAAADGGSAVVLTFSPHPSRLLRPENPVPQILDDAGKDRRVAMLGPDCIVHEPFTPELAALDAVGFLSVLFRAIPGLSAIHVGRNFRFGHDRAGDVNWLQARADARGFRVFGAANIAAGGAPVSSTRIRKLIAEGGIADANALLGYPYAASGAVVSGRALGRTIGVPTLNLPWAPELLPRFGVYAVRARVVGGDGTDDNGTDGDWFSGVANYGLRPTVEDVSSGAVRPQLETHLLAPAGAVGAAGFAAGVGLRVEWLHFLRPEKKFDGLDALRVQIAADIANARAVLAE